MNKKIISALAFMFSGAILTGCSMTRTETIETAHTVNIPPKMLFLGDSIPDGYGLDGYSVDDNSHCMSYPNILKYKYSEELKGIDTQMINKSVSGDTSQDLINLIDSGDVDKYLKESDAVIVSIGGNDIMSPIYGLLESFKDSDADFMSIVSAVPQLGDDIDAALVSFEENLKIISDKLKDKTNAKIFIQNLYDPTEYIGIDMVTDFTGKKVNKFNDIIADNANNYSVIDVYSQFTGKSGELTNMPDFDIHPNAEGHKLMADIVDTELRKSEYTYYTYESEEHISNFAIGLLCGCSALAAIGLTSLFIMLKKKKK